MSDWQEWKHKVPVGVWRYETSDLEGGFRSAVAEVLGVRREDLLISNVDIDNDVFDHLDSTEWVFASDGDTLYLLTKAQRLGVQNTLGWAPAAQCPLPPTWEETRAWLRAAARMF